MADSLRIVELRAENLKRLRAVHIRPDGSVVQITGANGAGKSSVLDSIYLALAGTKGAPTQPVRKGEKAARIEIDLGDVVVTRRFTAGGGTTLELARKDGTVFKKPQAALDGILGALTFDPLAFTRMAPKDQLEQLRALVKLDIDLAAVDRKRTEAYEHRTDVNRRVKTLQERADSLRKSVDETIDVTPIDTTAMLDEMQSAGVKAAEIARDGQDRKAKAERISAGHLRAEKLRRQAAAMLEEAQAEEDEANRLVDQLNALPPLEQPVDVTALRQQLTVAEAENQKRSMQQRARVSYEQAKAELEAARKSADRLTEEIESCEAEKAAAIARAEMPIDGLSFGDGMVVYNSLPFDQASSAEQLRVATAIGMAMNPKLRILTIKDGSLLDETSLAELERMAEENDFQIWLERVDVSGKHGIVIEDGAVVGAPTLELVEAGD